MTRDQGIAGGARVSYHEVATLPALAWLAEVDLPAMAAVVFHGASVEIGSGWFIEGAWNGPFAEGGFGNTDCVFGSGGILREDGLLFVSSATTTDYLYYHRDSGRVSVSNSLPCLLAGIGETLDPQFAGYDRINHSIILGINGYVREIPTRGGKVFRLIYRNLLVTADGVSETDKPMAPAFEGFSAYYDYLARNVERVFENARDRGRKTSMQVFSTQSRGYDSTAVNALAGPFGIDKVFTVRQGKGKDSFAERDRNIQVNDDGTEICEVLGLPCVGIDRRAFEKEFDDEYLFYAALDNNGDANLKDIFRHVNGVALLLTGCLGEIWYVTETFFRNWGESISADLTRGDLGNHGLAEVRLAAGIVQLPPAFIGGRRRENIFDITRSKEMDPWRLGVAYDRPIPRRIAEQAGVPRELFGQVKMASVVDFSLPRVPYGRALREEYLDFLAANRLLSRWRARWHPVVHAINSVLNFATPRRYRAVYYVERAISRIIGRKYSFPLIWSRLNGSIFCFCVNKRVEDYRGALAGNGVRRASVKG